MNIKRKITFFLVLLVVLVFGFNNSVKATETESENSEPENEVVENEHAHNFTIDSGTVVEPTCTTEGYTKYKCNVEGCDEVYLDKYIPALGHSYDLENGWTVVKEASEVEVGIRVNKCLVCEYELVEEIPLIVYSSQVVIKNIDYGDILVDIEKGNVGDVVTVYAKPYAFCKLINITVNGVELIANEEGNYQFVMVEGENIISGKFEIDSEQFKEVAQLLADAKDGNWENIFNIENIITIIFAILSFLMSSGFLITLLKCKKIKSETSNDFATSVSNAINANSAKAITDFLNNAMQPIFDKIDGKMVSVEEVCKTLTRCFILSQENTPESRLAIINELTALQKTNEELSAQVKAIIANEVSKNEEIKNSKIKALEELEKANNSLSEKLNTVKENVNKETENIHDEEDAKGRY